MYLLYHQNKLIEKISRRLVDEKFIDFVPFKIVDATLTSQTCSANEKPVRFI